VSDQRLVEIVERTKAATEQMREGMERMQAALDDAWEWYEAVRDEAAAVTTQGEGGETR